MEKWKNRAVEGGETAEQWRSRAAERGEAEQQRSAAVKKWSSGAWRNSGAVGKWNSGEAEKRSNGEAEKQSSGEAEQRRSISAEKLSCEEAEQRRSGAAILFVSCIVPMFGHDFVSRRYLRTKQLRDVFVKVELDFELENRISSHKLKYFQNCYRLFIKSYSILRFKL